MADSEGLVNGLSVVNMATGLAAALAGKLLGDMGCRVVRVSPTGADPFGDLYPAYETLRAHERSAPYPYPGSATTLNELLAAADVCIVGGEDFPGLKSEKGLAAKLSAAHHRLIAVELTGYPSGSNPAGRPAVDLLVQARSGLVYEQFSRRPNVMSFQPTHYGAALLAVIGALAALYSRERDGRGQVVATSLYEGALAWVTPWGRVPEPDAAFETQAPVDSRPLILQCADGKYIQIVLGAVGSKYNLYKVLRIDDPTLSPTASGVASPEDPPEKFFGDVELLAPYVARWNRADLLRALTEARVSAASILDPAESWDDPQTRHNSLIVTAADGTRHVGNPIAFSLSAAKTKSIPAGTGSPLSGLRIVDFGAFTAGPFSSGLLRTLGADVIKVELPTGDPSRGIFRAFTASNRGKRSIALDMKSPVGIEIVKRLCARADVVTSNFRTGVAERLGIDGASLQRERPELIVLDSSAFGSGGPRGSEGAFDLSIVALTGHEVRAGGVGNPPLWNRIFLGDYGGGLLGAVALLGALVNRARRGHGASLNVSLFNTGIFLQSELIQRPDGAFKGAPLLNSKQTGFHPAESLYQCRDGWIAIAVRDEKSASRLREVLGLNDRLPVNWRTWSDPQAALLTQSIAECRIDDLLASLDASGVWAEKCRQHEERVIFADESLEALGIIGCASNAKYGHVWQITPLPRFSKSSKEPAVSAPALGEHTRAILCELGFGPEEIDAAFNAKAVR
jgi:crotonobetainyl-CoA:carnitine CoA-transferase CaiB-like acyl-CoA transferase